MKSFSKYFSYHIGETLPRSIVVSLIAFFCVLIADRLNVRITIHALASAFILMLTPAFELAPMKIKRNIDTIVSLPIDRKTTMLVHWLSGLLQSLFAVFLSFTPIFFDIVSNKTELKFAFIYLGLTTLVGISLFSLYCFVFSEANTIFDGAVFIFCYSYIFALIGVALWSVADIDVFSFPTLNSPLIFGSFADIVIFAGKPVILEEQKLITLACIFWVIVGAISANLYLYRAPRTRTEKVGDISNSPFGYSALIPLTAYSILILVKGIWLLTIPVAVAMFIGYVIYRRSISLGLLDIIFISTSFYFTFLGGAL